MEHDGGHEHGLGRVHPNSRRAMFRHGIGVRPAGHHGVPSSPAKLGARRFRGQAARFPVCPVSRHKLLGTTIAITSKYNIIDLIL